MASPRSRRSDVERFPWSLKRTAVHGDPSCGDVAEGRDRWVALDRPSADTGLDGGHRVTSRPDDLVAAENERVDHELDDRRLEVGTLIVRWHGAVILGEGARRVRRHDRRRTVADRIESVSADGRYAVRSGRPPLQDL